MKDGMKVVFNGDMINESEMNAVGPLLYRNYIYACINTFRHRPLYLERHLHYASQTYEKLYGTTPVVDGDGICRAISEMLDVNRMPRLGNIVNIYLIPPHDGNIYDRPDILVRWERSTLYNGYELISIRPKIILTNYEIPFSGHRTSVSLTVSDYMRSFAVRSGSHEALRINRAEKVISCGEYPVFFVKDGTVYTPPLPDESPVCVEGELMKDLCSMAGVELVERSISACEIGGADEIMVFNHTGLQSVLCWGNYYFYNLTARRLEKSLPEITMRELK